MELITKDIELIRETRHLCLKQDFDKAIDLARKVNDLNARDTLLSICRSFKTSKFSRRAA